MIMQSRWKKLEQKLNEKSLDAFLLTSSADIFYFSGLSLHGATMVTAKNRFFFIPPMYQEVALKAKNTGEVLICQNDFTDAFANVSRKLNIKRCGFDPNYISFSLYQKIKEKLTAEFVPGGDIIQTIRVIKEAAEINLIRKAGKITIDAFDYLRKVLCNQISEREVVKKSINYILKEANAVSFSPIVLFGERTSLPHGTHSERKLSEDDLVLIDLGAQIEGYCADMTRTFMLGKAQQEWEEVYNFVKMLQDLAIQNIRPGIKASEIDALIREKAIEANYEKNMLHSAGHGIGIEVHEQPILKLNTDTILEQGMVVCIEPGIYFAGKGGIRIEDMVLVTNQGGEILP